MNAPNQSCPLYSSMSAHLGSLPGKELDVQSTHRSLPVTSLMNSFGNGKSGRNSDSSNKKSNKLTPPGAFGGGTPSNNTNGIWNYKSKFIAGGGAGAAWFTMGSLAHATPLWPFKGNRMQRKKARPSVLILMSDTGGGHRASAEALRAGFQQLFGDKYKVDIIDLWTDHTPWPVNQMPKSYSFMVKYPFIWRFNFMATQPRFVHIPIATASTAIVASSIAAAFDAYDPDLVVSVHPLMQHIPVRVLGQYNSSRQSKPPASFATVVTDLTTCHNTWFCPAVDRCYVATEETRQQALKLGLSETQIRLYGLPIRPSFSRRYPPKRVLRRTLGMDLHKPAILLVGGGEGMGPVEKTVDALVALIGSECQIVVVCGRNARLVDTLQTKSYPQTTTLHVKGFVNNMPELMCASDVIITKAGPGTITEALICGLPLVLNAYVPCQEEGNIPYVTENGVGVFVSKPIEAAEVIKDWLAGGQKKLQSISSKAKALGKPHALFDIVRDLSTFLRPCLTCA